MTGEENQKQLETLEATFQSSIFEAADKSFCIYRYMRSDGSQVIAVGTDLPNRRQLPVLLHGTWEISKKTGGKQLRVAYSEAAPVRDRDQVISYLCSLKCGIGKMKAMAIWKRYGEASWDGLDNDPDKMVKDTLISPKILERLMDAQKSAILSRNLLKLFAEANIPVGGDMIHRLIERHGEKADVLLRDNPYIAISRDEPSFEKADALADALGFAKNDPRRMAAVIVKVLDDAAVNGHVCVPKEMLLDMVKTYTGCPMEECVKAINAACREKKAVYSSGFVYAKRRYDEETAIADNIQRLMTACSDPVRGLDAFISDYERENFSLAESQREAILRVFESGVSVITGGPGTGKSTVTNAILYVHKKAYGESSEPILLAPTGKAARRLGEASGCGAQTIHSAVGWRGDEVEAEPCSLHGNLFIIDESSMMDQFVCDILLEAIPSGARVVFVGDCDQLPSVGCGNVLSDFISSEVIPTTRLHVIFRQAEDNPIIENARRMNEGDSNLIYTDTFRFYEAHSSDELFESACDFYARCVEAYGITNVMLLNPQRNHSDLTVDRFNAALQERINPPSDDKNEIRIGRQIFREGDRVMELRNTERSKNGDTGVIHRIEKRESSTDPPEFYSVAIIEFNDDGVLLDYNADDLHHVTLAYANTVHKAQGEEFQTVIMVITKAHYAMLRRNLVYTAVTRAKQHVVLMGQLDALDTAVKNNQADVRYTLLAARLRHKLKK